jgi:hypothetical protein
MPHYALSLYNFDIGHVSIQDHLKNSI